MSASFRVFDMHSRILASESRDDVRSYLRSLHRRFSNAIHAETRVFTCRRWSRQQERTPARSLHWNDVLPDELQLGTIGWSVSEEVVRGVEDRLGWGEAVWLFVFDSDAELAYEEVLVPTPRGAGPSEPERR